MAHTGPCIAALGASANGFDAVLNFFSALPADTGIAFVVVPQIDPDHPGPAWELFGQSVSQPVTEAVDGMLVEANHVYTPPSGKELSIKGGRLQLVPRCATSPVHLPIDHFFSALGKDCGARAIGIVMSGKGTDGTLGLKEIVAQGGMVLVQDPETAQQDGMPRSAMATGLVNQVLPVERMPEVLLAYARYPDVEDSAAPGLGDNDASVLKRVFNIIQAHCGFDFSVYKRGTMWRRVQRRMGLHNLERMDEYLMLLLKDPHEADALFRDLLIGVTAFFRDAEAWKTLDIEVIAPLVASRQENEPIRIWIPGCSTGEEAYTMAMVVHDRLRRARKHCPVQIFATDTNNDALEVGRLGRYPAKIAEAISPARLRRYFVQAAEPPGYVVSHQLRVSVVFGQQNLFSDPPFGRVDLISCRNVLIYLEPDLQKRILNIFHFSLRKEAGLFLGSTESNGGRDDLFSPLSKKWRIFRRVGKTPSDWLAFPAVGGLVRQAGTADLSRNGASGSRVALMAQKLILDRFAPASVLVDSHYDVLHFFGPTEEFLLPPRGAPTRNLLVMAREWLRPRLRAALREASSSGRCVCFPGAQLKRAGGFLPIDINVMPVAGGDLASPLLVVFRHDLNVLPVSFGQGTDGALVGQLEEELQTARDDLQNTIERFESVNETLRISSEETETTNEELRSLNEELESSRAEQQSLNDALNRTNQQLQRKLRELEGANSDLHNLLNSNDIATVCLDQTLRIKWFTPATQAHFKFFAGDIGRSIRDFSLAWAGDGLIEAAAEVLSTGAAASHEIRTETGCRYIRRVLPYRTGERTISGVIVTFTDVTEIQSAMEAADMAHKDLTESRIQHDKLRALSTALALAEERERRALAQDLHDDLGQLLAVIGIKAAAIRAHKMTVPMRQAVEDCSRVVEQANRKLRAMAFQLNPPMLEQLGFSVALEWMADELHRLYQLEVTADDDGTPKPMEPAVSATVFRAVRELLINVAKHAGVDKAAVSAVRGEGNMLVVTVSDAGTGFDPDAKIPVNGSGGFGLLSLRERLSLLGGAVEIRSIPGEGTSVILKVPLLPAVVAAGKTTAYGRAS
mgnify:CR=1 FL=1